jgi:rRNA-processing protein FCF1
MRVRLAPGVAPERAIATINEIAGNRAAATPPGVPLPSTQRMNYVRWATNAEAQLVSVLHRDDARAFFDSPRHRDICSMLPDDHVITLINAEVDGTAHALRETSAYLQGQLSRLRAGPGCPVIVDSNVLLQCQRLDNVAWRPQLKDEARLMVPLRVMEELDAKKYGDSKRLRGIARELLPWVDSLFPDGTPGPVPLRADATIELVIAERPRYRPADADEEVLDLTHEVVRFVGAAKLMTADTGMRIRARSEGLDVLYIPAEWRRSTGDD